MKKILTGCTFLLFIAISVSAGTAWADDELNVNRDAAERFATLPGGVRFPEGITANPVSGDIYVGTFDSPPNNNPNKLLRFAHDGRLVAQRDFGATPLLGLEFDRRGKKVYIASVGVFAGGASKIQRIAANFNATTPIEDVALLPQIGAPVSPRTVPNPDGSSDTITFGSSSVPVPNAMAFDRRGNLYVSDSFQGAIFRIDNPVSCAPACDVTTLVHDPLLATAGFPPFGANGIAFNGDESALFIANTGDDRILKLDMASHAITVFAESINGADGIAFDEYGRLWVAANQADEVVALNANGRVVAKLGDFQGIRNDGSPNGLLFPASLVLVGDDMFVTNLALPLTADVAGDEPEEDVTRYTVSRIKLPNH